MGNMEDLPCVSIVLPTYNSATVISTCLESIRQQDYPIEKVEIVVADGGSKDETVEIARRFGVSKVLYNPLRTGEAGKAVGLGAARNEIICFVDSDNVLPSKDWLRKLVRPFQEPFVIGSEPIRWEYRSQDPLIVRYAALCGDNDPFGFYTGTRAHWSWGRLCWADMKLLRPYGSGELGYLVRRLPKKTRLPSFGANGFAARREIIDRVFDGAYYVDVDVVHNMVQRGYDVFAKVDIGIIHLHARNLTDFLRKAYRRIRDYIVFRPHRSSPPPGRKETLHYILYSLILFPLVVESVRGYGKKPDIAWFFHPVACELVFYLYAISYPFLLFVHRLQKQRL